MITQLANRSRHIHNYGIFKMPYASGSSFFSHTLRSTLFFTHPLSSPAPCRVRVVDWLSVRPDGDVWPASAGKLRLISLFGWMFTLFCFHWGNYWRCCILKAIINCDVLLPFRPLSTLCWFVRFCAGLTFPLIKIFRKLWTWRDNIHIKEH